MISCNRNSYEDSMRISERGQVTIPKPLRDRFGMNPNVEVEITPTENGLLIQKRTAAKHPVDRIYGIVSWGGSTDDYIEEIRGR
ncbi:MAG: AbrB/MazE/SpoVT family DNA-binding domain-containing protein [Acidobacteria bacterium]|nr:AbrB/MazE/SpoVT family DNA-binding domain-containing protein [Acidobacteriota bacterium]